MKQTLDIEVSVKKTLLNQNNGSKLKSKPQQQTTKPYLPK
jgi:hypothetical protein